MAIRLAILEAILLFGVGCGMIVFWSHTVLSSWLALGVLVLKATVLSSCCVVSFYYNDLYDFRIVRGFSDFASRLLQSFGVAFILLAGFYTLFPRANIAGGPFVSSLLVILGLLVPLRFASYAVMRRRSFSERVLILGTSPLSHKLIAEIEAQPHCGYVVAGVVDEEGRELRGAPADRVVGPIQALDQIIGETKPDRIVVALADRRGRMPVAQLLQARMHRILVEEGVEMYERLTGKLAIEALTPSSLIFSRDFMKSRFDLAVGRQASLVISAIGLVGLAPVLAAIAVAIKLDSAGPVFFVQDRVGVHGRRFPLIKFRTMHPVDGQTSEWVRDNAHRITRVGNWLRKFRLDELPQFINILLGDMNLVGPRPHPVSNFELFVARIPYYTLRYGVRPGVTGWAQIRYGYANDLQEETEKMRFDLYYIKHLSLWLDVRILFDTVKIVLFGRGTRAADADPGREYGPVAVAEDGGAAAPRNGTRPALPGVMIDTTTAVTRRSHP